MIQQAGSQFNEALMKSSGKAVEEARDKPGMLVDKDTAQIINLMSVQSNPQLKLKFGNLDSGEFEMNGVKLIYHENAFTVKDNIYELSDEFLNFLTNPNIKHGEMEEDENKIKRFLKDIRFDLGKGDKKSDRYRIINRIIGIKDDVYGRGLNSNPNQQICHHYVDPNSLIERLELLILETIAGHDGLYNEMLDISKQLLSMNIINQEQLDNFVFNYGKEIMMEKQQQQQLLAKEVFSPQITKFRRERIIPLYEDEIWSADLIDKSPLTKYNNNYKFILTVIDIFTKYAWAIPLKNKSGLSITNGFKIVLSEHPQGGSEPRKPEKLWVDRDSEFYNKTFKTLLKEYETKLYSTYSDLKAVFTERFNRTLLPTKKICSSMAMVIG